MRKIERKKERKKERNKGTHLAQVVLKWCAAQQNPAPSLQLIHATRRLVLRIPQAMSLGINKQWNLNKIYHDKKKEEKKKNFNNNNNHSIVVILRRISSDQTQYLEASRYCDDTARRTAPAPGARRPA
jgi:hypothetical protein